MRTKVVGAVAAALTVAGVGLVGPSFGGEVAGSNETPTPVVHAIKRSMPNGKTDVIKAMGNTKWGDIELTM